MTQLYSDIGKLAGSIKPVPLTIIDPRQFDSFYSINEQVLLDNAKSVVGGVVNTAIDQLQSIVGTTAGTIGGLVAKDLSQNLINAVFETHNISEDSLAYFRFRINPNRLSKRRKKIVTQKYTGNGWDVDTRGEEMIVYSYNGSSGSLVPIEMINRITSVFHSYLKNSAMYESYLGNLIDYIIYNPKLSSAYLKMVLFETFWKSNNDDLLIVYEDNAYLGKFNSFEWNQDAMNPYQINYSFDFVVYPEFNYNTNTGWITLEADTKMRKRFNRIPTTPIVGVQTAPNNPNLYTNDDNVPISENEIVFDTTENNLNDELRKRIKMANFYAKDTKVVGIFNVVSKVISTGISIVTSLLSADVINQKYVWLDGSIQNTGTGTDTQPSVKSIINRITYNNAKQPVISTDVSWVEKGLHIVLGKNPDALVPPTSRENISKISPQELATRYNNRSGIDIFEDAINFNLKRNK